MTGFFNSLTPRQRAAALAHRGQDTVLPMLPPAENVIQIELDKKLARKDVSLFERLFCTGPLTRRVDLLAAALNRR